VANGFLLWRVLIPRPERIAVGKFPEKLVYVRSRDDLADAGVIFLPPKELTKSTAVIWIHGWGVNFYVPSYVAIGRALAERGYTTVSANTRMHDIGNVAGYRTFGKRIRGGGYWGVASDQKQDIAAWIDFAAEQGFHQVVLVGHSAGWAAVRQYQAEKQDPRVVGLVAASGQVYPSGPPDASMIAEARRLVAQGRGDDLLRFPTEHRSYPSFVSAATYLDSETSPAEMEDFYGIKIDHSAVTRVHCPLLVWFGSKDDVGTDKDLEAVKSAIKRQSIGPSRVDAALIQHADHMYDGQEQQVADILTAWMNSAVPKQ
jgi:pimeloyl-ACP methyl ester carboxylesterase